MQAWYEGQLVDVPLQAQQQQHDADLQPPRNEEADLRQEVDKKTKKIAKLKLALKHAYQRTRNAKRRLSRSSTSTSQKKKSARTIELLEVQCSSLRKQLATTHAKRAAEQRLKLGYQRKLNLANKDNKQLKLKKVEQRRTASPVEKPGQPHIVTMHGRPPQYADNIRTCCITLLAHNVGTLHVSPVIKTVIETLTPFSIGRLPSAAKMSDFLGEAKQLALNQVGEELVSEGNLTMHRDGTTKRGNKYYGAQVATSGQVLNVGLSTLKSGTAQHSFEAVLDMLDDIETACQNAGSTDHIKVQALANIKNTMTDRSIIEKNVNVLLKDYRANVLPEVTAGWDSLSVEAQDGLKRMNNLFCGLHYIVGLADQAQECLGKWEKQSSAAMPDSTEVGTVRLVRTACKALEAHCCEQSGSHTQFKAYLHGQGIDAIPLARFVGNRFNILFVNAGGVYYLRKHMELFYDKVLGTPNRLHIAVRADLANQLHIVGCRALGIIDKLITGPLWRVLASADVSIARVSTVYQQLVESLDVWSVSAVDLLDGSACPFTGAAITIDSVHEELFTTSNLDNDTGVLLQLLCACFSTFRKITSLMVCSANFLPKRSRKQPRHSRQT